MQLAHQVMTNGKPVEKGKYNFVISVRLVADLIVVVVVKKIVAVKL